MDVAHLPDRLPGADVPQDYGARLVAAGDSVVVLKIELVFGRCEQHINNNLGDVHRGQRAQTFLQVGSEDACQFLVRREDQA